VNNDGGRCYSFEDWDDKPGSKECPRYREMTEQEKRERDCYMWLEKEIDIMFSEAVEKFGFDVEEVKSMAKDIISDWG